MYSPPRSTAPQRPGEVSLTSGSLTLRQPDLSLTGLGPALGLERVYSSANAEKQGAFGYGWDFSLNQRLRMYTGYHITEHRGDGSRMGPHQHPAAARRRKAPVRARRSSPRNHWACMR